jgi:predicted permease
MALGKTLSDFLVAQALVWGPLALGHRLEAHRWVSDRLARPLHAVTVIGLSPVIFVLGIWKLDRGGDDWWRVPFAYGLLLVFSSVIALALSPRLFRNPKSVGTHILLVAVSNIGHTMAGFLTILLIGVEAYPLNAILILPCYLFIALVWFPAAAHWGGGGDARSFGGRYWRLVFSPLALPLLGIAGGLALNFAGTPMTAGWVRLMKALVFVTTALTMFAIGCRLRLRHALCFWNALRWLYAVKFVAHPLIAVALCALLGLHGPAAGVLLIAAIMPAGVMAIQYSTIEDLDVDLANAGFLLSTAVFMILVLPVLILLLRLPMFC